MRNCQSTFQPQCKASAIKSAAGRLSAASLFPGNTFSSASSSLKYSGCPGTHQNSHLQASHGCLPESINMPGRRHSVAHRMTWKSASTGVAGHRPLPPLPSCSCSSQVGFPCDQALLQTCTGGTQTLTVKRAGLEESGSRRQKLGRLGGLRWGGMINGHTASLLPSHGAGTEPSTGQDCATRAAAAHGALQRKGSVSPVTSEGADPRLALCLWRLLPSHTESAPRSELNPGPHVQPASYQAETIPNGSSNA